MPAGSDTPVRQKAADGVIPAESTSTPEQKQLVLDVIATIGSSDDTSGKKGVNAEQVKAFFAEGHDPSQPIVVYCSGGECEDSHMLATKLHMAGFDNALVYKDGFPDWQKRGLPVHTGDTP